jgi:hypothetical protein
MKSCLVRYAEILKKDSWFSNQFWNDYMWFVFLKSLCFEFKQAPQEVNVPRLIASLVQPQFSTTNRMYVHIPQIIFIYRLN